MGRPRTAKAKTRVARWGNSLGLRIPKPLAEALGLLPGGEVAIEVREEGLFLRPLRTGGSPGETAEEDPQGEGERRRAGKRAARLARRIAERSGLTEEEVFRRLEEK